MLQVEKCGLRLNSDLQRLQDLNTPQEIENPQTLWKKFKEDIKY